MSYDTDDRLTVQRIKDGIENRGGDNIYVYEDDPRPGESITESAKDRIRESDLFLVFLTPNSRGSEWVNQEIGSADAVGCPLFPVVQKGPDQTAPGGLLGNVEYLTYDPERPEDFFNDFLESVGRREVLSEGDEDVLDEIIAHQPEPVVDREPEGLFSPLVTMAELLVGRAVLNLVKRSLYRAGSETLRAMGFNSSVEYPPVETGDELDVEIERVDSSGEGIVALAPGFDVRVPGVEAGEEVRIRVNEVGEQSALAEVIATNELYANE